MQLKININYNNQYIEARYKGVLRISLHDVDFTKSFWRAVIG